MPTTTRNLTLSCLVVIIVACICLSLVSIVGAVLVVVSQRVADQVDTELPIEMETPVPIEDQMDLIEQQISEIRSLEIDTEISRSLLSTEELRQRVFEDFLNDYSQEEAREDALVLWSFGLLDRDFDLYNFYLELYSEQIAGFYDSETKEMFVIQNDAFAGPERLTYAHEFVHALQDVHYDIENGLRFNDADCKEDGERCTVISALLEGDASLAETQWLSKYATPRDNREIAEFYTDFSSPVFDSAPAFMQEDFIFPYQRGQDFVQSLYDEGGWEAVNNAYSQPPTSTEQILHPERYPDDMPIKVEMPDLTAVLGSGWDEIDRGVVGEWYTYLILSAGMDTDANLSNGKALRAAAGWEGDSYIVLYNQEQDTINLVMTTLWDSDTEASEFSQAFYDYASGRFGEILIEENQVTMWASENGVHAIYEDGSYTAWIMAQDIDSVRAIWDQLPIP